MARTKIVCTIGPASRSPETLEQLIRAGMDVARLNFSHGTQTEHLEVITTLRRIAERLGKSIAILQDLAGLKIRIGEIASGAVMLEAGAPWALRRLARGRSGLAALNQHAERGALVAGALGAPVAVVELIRRHEDTNALDERQRLLRIADDSC